MGPSFDEARDRLTLRGAGLGDRELAGWCNRVADVPDLRLAKVMRVRRAIGSNQYDEAAMLERTLGELEAELGALCRDGAADEWR